MTDPAPTCHFPLMPGGHVYYRAGCPHVPVESRLRGIINDILATGEQEADKDWTTARQARAKAREDRWVAEILAACDHRAP